MAIIMQLTCTDTKPLRRGKEYFWKVIYDLSADGSEFTFADVYGRCDPGLKSSVHNYLTQLCRGGYAVRDADLPLQKYRMLKRPLIRPIIDDNGKKCAKGMSGAGRQHMWNVMRRNRDGWTAKELAISATTEDVAVSLQTAQQYSNALLKAGCLVHMGVNAERRIVYRLKGSANTGPRCPIRVAGKAIFDPNTNRLVGDVLLVGEES